MANMPSGNNKRNRPNPDLDTLWRYLDAAIHDERGLSISRMRKTSFHLRDVPKGQWTPLHEDFLDAFLHAMRKAPHNADFEQGYFFITENLGALCRKQGKEIMQLAPRKYFQVEHLESLLAPALPETTSKNMHKFMRAFARMKRDLHPETVQIITDSLSSRIQQGGLDDRLLSEALHSLSMLEIHPSDEFMQTWFAGANEYLANDGFDEVNLSNSLNALGRLRIVPPRDFLERWFVVATHRIQKGEFEARHLVGSLHAMSKLGIDPPVEFLQAWFASMTEKMADGELDRNPRTLSNAMYAVSRLAISPPDSYMQAWSDCVAKNIHEAPFKHQGFGNNLYALAILKVINTKIPEGLVSLLVEKMPDMSRDSHPHQLFLAGQVFAEFSYPAGRIDRPDNSQLQGYFSTHIRREAKKASEKSDKQIRYDVEDEVVLPAINSSVDVVATATSEAGGEQYVTKSYIQLDGPRHFVYDLEGNKRPDGASLLQNYIAKGALEPEGHSWRRISYDRVNNAEGTAYVDKLVQEEAETQIAKLRFQHIKNVRNSERKKDAGDQRYR